MATIAVFVHDSEFIDVSGVTQQAAAKAHQALHDAEGFASKKLDEAQSKLEKKAGVSGNGMYQEGDGMFQAGDMRGDGHYFQMASRAGLPPNAVPVGLMNHFGAFSRPEASIAGPGGNLGLGY